MEQPKIEWTKKFQTQLNKLSRKNRGIHDKVVDSLTNLAKEEIPDGSRIPRASGLRVYKMRIPLENRGKSGGARLIYYRDANLILALFIYAKNSQTRVSPEEIKKALRDYFG